MTFSLKCLFICAIFFSRPFILVLSSDRSYLVKNEELKSSSTSSTDENHHQTSTITSESNYEERNAGKIIQSINSAIESEDLLRGSYKSDADGNSKTSYNYDETSYLLSSDTALDREPFLMRSRNAKELELQEDVSNITHEAVLSAKSLDRSVYVVPPLTIELSESAKLLLTPNVRQEISFEVTNNLDSISPVEFYIKDEMRILLEADKYRASLVPHETITVRLSILPRVGMTSDRISFTATGSQQIKKEVIVDIDNNQFRSDDDYPDVDYTYTSDCTDVLLSKCQHGTWTIKVLARDRDSGLMLLTSIPKGLYFPDGYISGTKEEITGYYSDTCCNPDLQIIAVDRRNNRIVKQANAYKAPLSFWAIIAIVVVSLVVLIIIIACIVFCVKKCKKDEGGSFELPSYRGAGTGTRY